MAGSNKLKEAEDRLAKLKKNAKKPPVKNDYDMKRQQLEMEKVALNKKIQEASQKIDACFEKINEREEEIQKLKSLPHMGGDSWSKSLKERNEHQNSVEEIRKKGRSSINKIRELEVQIRPYRSLAQLDAALADLDKKLECGSLGGRVNGKQMSAIQHEKYLLQHRKQIEKKRPKVIQYEKLQIVKEQNFNNPEMKANQSKLKDARARVKAFISGLLKFCSFTVCNS